MRRIISIAFILLVTGPFVLAENFPGVKQVLVLPIVVGGEPTPHEVYTSVIDMVSTSGPAYFKFTGFSNVGSPLSVYCDFMGPLSNMSFGQGGSGWEGRWEHYICGQFDPIMDNGWILVELWDANSIQVTNKIIHVRYVNNFPKLQNAMIVPAIKSTRRFIAPITNDYKNDGWDVLTSYAIVNPSEDQTAVISLDAGRRKPDKPDPPECRRTISLPPRHRIAQFINELFPTCDTGGAMKIESNIPIAVSAVEVYLPSYEFIALPVDTY